MQVRTSEQINNSESSLITCNKPVFAVSMQAYHVSNGF